MVYDLLECLKAFLDSAGLSHVPVYFISPVASSSLSHSNIYAEWSVITQYTAIHDGFNGPSTFDPTDRCLLHVAELREFHCVERIKSPSFNCLFHLLLNSRRCGSLIVHISSTEKPS